MPQIAVRKSLLERILVPLDGSAVAEAILPRVFGLLKRADADIVLMQAVPADRLGQRAAAESWLRQRSERLSGDGVKARFVVDEGPAAEGILAAADRERASLIALSTHGRSAIPRFVFGSIAEKVIRASHLPVLVMRADLAGKAGAAGPWTVRRIVLPVDGSPLALAAIPAAVDLARAFAAEVLVLRVAETYFTYGVGGHLGQVGIPVSSEAVFEPADVTAADARLAASRLEAAGVKVTHHTVTGDASSSIVDFCGPHGGDLIVMASHGRSGPSRWILGSVTEKVLRSAAVPVLVVPQERKKA